MPCGMELRRIRNRRALAVLDAYGSPIEPGGTGDVDPHDEGIVAGLAAGDFLDLGPAGAAKPHRHEHEMAAAERPTIAIEHEDGR